MEFFVLISVVATSEVVITNVELKMQNDPQSVGKNQHLEPMQAPSRTVTASGSRPPSNYNNQSQVGSQKGVYLYLQF